MRISLYGPPSSGKSTIAAYLYAQLKAKKFNIELCREFVKDWAYLNRPVKGFDQLLIFANQLHSEAFMLQHGVDHIITDSPPTLSPFYGHRLSFSEDLINIWKKFDEQYPSLNIFLISKDIDYVSHGRYHDFEQAKLIENRLEIFLDDNKINYYKFSAINKEQILEFVESRLI